MKRIVLWGLSTLTALVALFGYHTSTSSVLATTTETAVTGSLRAKAAAGTTSARTVTGETAQTRWGPVQVQIEVTGSQVTHVEVLQYPDQDGRSVQINQYALPRLVQETLDAQSGDIAMVSGATYTSQGYLQSLQSALDQAAL